MATGAPPDSLARELARQNAAELAALPDAPGPEHIAAFAESARSCGRRLPQLWPERPAGPAGDDPWHLPPLASGRDPAWLSV